MADEGLVAAASVQVSASDARTTLAKLGGGPTSTIPQTTRSLPMAHATEAPVRAVEAALAEAREKRPGWAKFVVGLVAPLSLASKGIIDLFRAISLDGATKQYFLDWPGLGLSLIAIVVGAAAAAAVGAQLVSDRKTSKTLTLAQHHVDEWLHEMGQKPLFGSQVDT